MLIPRVTTLWTKKHYFGQLCDFKCLRLWRRVGGEWQRGVKWAVAVNTFPSITFTLFIFPPLPLVWRRESKGDLCPLSGLYSQIEDVHA